MSVDILVVDASVLAKNRCVITAKVPYYECFLSMGLVNTIFINRKNETLQDCCDR
ncbi:hypothetical protein G4P69_15440 [Aetokthonos hydrillicola CCALA 1050]|jgi:hypothetical protein|nr:hypothetical protein [Aetokthonos hydrillicola CCALA 1050]